jgi:hypothetical protein
MIITDQEHEKNRHGTLRMERTAERVQRTRSFIDLDHFANIMAGWVYGRTWNWISGLTCIRDTMGIFNEFE